jgi:hypothetical protein
MHPAPSYVPRPQRLTRSWWSWAAAVVAVLPVVIYLAGIPLHDGAPGTCDAWSGCTASDREQWGWTAQPWAATGVMLGAFIAGAARIAPWLRARPKVVRRAAIGALFVLVPITAGFALVGVLVLGNDCSDGEWLCFGGPSAALALGSPGAVTGAVSVLLVTALVRGDRIRASAVSVLAVTVLAAGVLAVVAWFVAGSVLGLLAAGLGA